VNLESPGVEVTLQADITSFFTRLSPITATKNAERFNAGVDTYVSILLNGDGVDMSNTITEMTRVDPQWASEFFQLWTRAVAAKSQSRLMERRIDVKKILSERIRLGKAKGKVNALRRRRII
jgi:hypothetical protein